MFLVKQRAQAGAAEKGDEDVGGDGLQGSWNLAEMERKLLNPGSPSQDTLNSCSQSKDLREQPF